MTALAQPSRQSVLRTPQVEGERIQGCHRCLHAKVYHDLESTDQDRPVVGKQNDRLNSCSDALGDVIDAPSTGRPLTGCVATEPATFHPAL